MRSFCIMRDIFVLFVFHAGILFPLIFLYACLLFFKIIPLLGLRTVLTVGIFLNFDTLLMFSESVYYIYIYIYILFFVIASTCTVYWLKVGVLFCVGSLFSNSSKLPNFSILLFDGLEGGVTVYMIVLLGIIFNLAWFLSFRLLLYLLFWVDLFLNLFLLVGTCRNWWLW